MQLVRVTIATLDMPSMVDFYNAVFDAHLAPYSAFASTLYKGSIGPLEVLLCPNDIAGVDARQNRKQLTFSVQNLAAVEARVKSVGGRIVNRSDDGTILGVSDPDGNTLEFILSPSPHTEE